jgi:hypothetical protein
MYPGSHELRLEIQLARKQIRAVEAGRMPLSEATALPEGAMLIDNKVVLPVQSIPQTAVLGLSGLAFFAWTVLGAALVVQALHLGLTARVSGLPVYLLLLLGIAFIIGGFTLYVARDVWHWRSTAIAQTLVGAGGGVVSILFLTAEPLTWVAPAAALVTVANGFDKFFKAKKLEISSLQSYFASKSD